MKISHVHLAFLDLPSAVQWMATVLNRMPVYQNDRMAVFPFDNISYVFDHGESDSVITMALASKNCESDFNNLVQRGALTLENPVVQPWGVKTAYLKGPGGVTFEIEESLA